MTIDFGSVITAMITPFKKEGKHEIDHEAVAKLVEHLVKTGTDTILVAGTTGECPTLSHEEEAELFKTTKATIERLGTNTKIIFGAGSNSTQTAIKMSQKAEELGADGLLMVTPYYNKPNQKGLKEHFSAIAKSTKLPIMLYNVPSRTNVSLSAETIIELANEFSNIHSLKEASNNFDILTQIRLSLKSNRFKIYSGDDGFTLAMMSLGADGVVSVASHFAGEDMQQMIKEFNAGNNEKALELHQKLFPLFDALFVEPNPTCAKAALETLGFCSSELREPLVPLSSEQKVSLERVVSSVLNKNATIS